MDVGVRRTLEENAVLELMVRLIQDYEAKHHPLPNPTPHEMLVYLMEQRGLKQANLLDIFASRGYVSDVVNWPISFKFQSTSSSEWYLSAQRFRHFRSQCRLTAVALQYQQPFRSQMS